MLKKIIVKIYNRYLFRHVLDIIRREVVKMENERIPNYPSLFAELGKGYIIPLPNTIHNPQYMKIGINFWTMYNLRIEAHDKFEDQRFTPEIIIGDNVRINTDCHIGCVEKITIGNNVLIASRVFISDHSHGDRSLESLKISPRLRALVTKGPVVIEDDVWIGEGAGILPGVRIGANSIIGANAVVTKDIPPYSVAVGVPAKVINVLNQS